MLTCDVSNNLQVEQMCLKFTLLSVFCCSRAVHNKHNNHAVKLRLLFSSLEEGEDAGIYKGFPLLHLLSHTFPSTFVHFLLPFASYHLCGLDLLKRIA